MSQSSLEQEFRRAVQFLQTGQFQQAEQIARQILAVQPRHPGTLQLLGMALMHQGRGDEAIVCLRRVAEVNPFTPEPHNNLGSAFLAKGSFKEAIAAFHQAIAVSPSYADAYNNLGRAYMCMGAVNEGVAAFRQATVLKPDFAEAHCNLGYSLRDNKQLDEAGAAFRQTIRLVPRHAEAYNGLAIVFREKGQLDDAIAAFRQALAINPKYPEALTNLGIALKDKGQLDEAVGAFRQAITLQPRLAPADSNLLFTLCYHPGFDAAAIAQEHRRWNQQHAEPLKRFLRPHGNDRSPDRRLRVGYVSPDFRNHVVGRFFETLLTHHNHESFEIFCYSLTATNDQATDRLRQMADVWRAVAGMSEGQIAQLIRNDQIDILVDLAMHTSGGKPLLYALKPAPIQATNMAYPGTTGIAAIDYRFTDPYLDPAGIDESIYAERTVRLPHTWWCYDPFDGRELPVNPLPALSGHGVTFGCLNNFCKINDGVLRLWAKVLHAVKSSRLLLLVPEGSTRQHFAELLQKEGITADRVEFFSRMAHQQYMELYNRIDIGLETLPYNGHSTSLDSYWMGVPVVTLVGQTIVGRAGYSQLMNLGLQELIAQTSEQYVQIATNLASDLRRLAELRSTLRSRMEKSPLMDVPDYARGIEMAYRDMWRKWRLSGPS